MGNAIMACAGDLGSEKILVGYLILPKAVKALETFGPCKLHQSQHPSSDLHLTTWNYVSQWTYRPPPETATYILNGE